MSFAHPLYLWGLLAVGVPIFVHLFNQRRPRPLQFGAIEFVLRSQRQKARRLRLRQLLLLALRCLLVAAIALALARPSLRPKGAQAAAAAGPQATALVIDASLSMRYRDGGQTLFARAKSEALSALDRLSPDEPATVGLCAGPGGFAGGIGAPSFDRAAQRRAINDAQPTWLTSDLTGCLAAAARALAESPVAGKRIFAFSDLAAHSIRLDAPPPLVPAAQGRPEVRPNVVLVDVARGKELSNAAVVAVEVRPAAALGARGYEVVSTVLNGGAQPVSGWALSLRLGDQTVAKGFVDVAPHATVKKTLGAVLPAGVVTGRVELARAEAEGLDEDDGEDFVVHVPRQVRALIVDGSPSSLRTRDEAFFAEAALGAARSGGRIEAHTVDADAAGAADLTNVDVVLLLNVPAPPKAFAEKLRGGVRRGMGLFIALGDHVDPDAYDDAFGDLLPRPLHLLKTAAEPGTQDADQRAARFGVVDWAHPVFRIFGPAEREGLLGTRTFRYALLRPDGANQSQTLAAWDDGAPALVTSRLGQGRVLLYTSSASHSWTDWPVRSSFLPVLQQVVSFLGGALEERQPQLARVGEERALDAVPGTQVERVLGPDGKDAPLRRENGRELVAVTLPGVYRPQAAGHDEPQLFFAAVTDARESDLRRVDEAELKAQLGGGSQVAASSAAASGAQGTPLWSALLVLGALALLGEGALTRR